MNGRGFIKTGSLGSGIVFAWLILSPSDLAAQSCPSCPGCAITGTVLPAEGGTNQRTVEVTANNFSGNLLFANTRPWGSITGCLGTGSPNWRFQAKGDTSPPGAPAYEVSPWVGGASCTGNGPNTMCGGGFFILLHRQGTVNNHKAPENRPRPPSGNQAPSCPTSHEGQPVSVVTGNMFLDQTDFVMPGWGAGINLTRSYNSMNGYHNVVGGFGRGWTHPYERKVEVVVVDLILRIWEGNGVATLYSDPDGDSTFEAYAPKTETSWIVESGGTYTRNFRDGSSEAYNSSGKLTSTPDPLGNTITLTYASGKLTGISDSANRQITFTYGGSRISSASGPAGLIATYTYDPIKPTHLKTVTYPDGSGYTFTYDTSGRLQKVQDHQGKVLETHTYQTGSGRAATSEIADGREKYTFAYTTTSGRITKTNVTDALGNLTVYEMVYLAGMSHVTKITGPCSSCGGSESQEWIYSVLDENGNPVSDEEGRVLIHRDGLGNTLSYTYDANGYLETETDPLNRTMTYTNDSQGRVLTRTDPEGGVTTWTYGAAGPLTIKDPLNRTTTITYHPQGKPETITDPRQKTTTLAYDAVGNLVSVTDPLNNQTQYDYDQVSQRTSVTDPLLNTTTTEYASLGRVKKIINPDGTFTEFGYDLGGRRTSVTDPEGGVTLYGYDAYGRLQTVTVVTGPPNEVTIYGYDAMSNLTSITDARGKVTIFDYDAHGRVEAVTYPKGVGEADRIETFTYDAAGRLVAQTKKDGSSIAYVYDAAGQLIQKNAEDPGGAPLEAVTLGYDDAGRMTLSKGGESWDELTWTYNLAGEVLTESFLGLPSTVTYTYDPAGNRETLKLNGQLYVSYDYDDAGRLWHIYRGSKVFTFGYDGASRRTSLSYPNGVVTTYGYDTLSRLTNVTTKLGTTVIAASTYTHDDAGNRLTKTTESYSESYDYDPTYRLDTVTRDFVLTEDYGYDAVGNRLSALNYPTWTYNDRNELQSFNGTTFTFDLNGRTVTKAEPTGTWDYTWTWEDHLHSVDRDGAWVASLRYDSLGRRVFKGTAPASRAYTYDGEDILRETNLLTGATLTFIHGPGIDEPLAAEDQNGNFFYAHADGLGSVVKSTNANGQVITTKQYDAFGNIQIGASDGRYAFTGREWDPETGLYYYRARYYDPKAGRFISEDPVPLGQRPLPQLNAYSYVANDPVNQVDPTGEGFVECGKLLAQLTAAIAKLAQRKAEYAASPDPDPGHAKAIREAQNRVQTLAAKAAKHCGEAGKAAAAAATSATTTCIFAVVPDICTTIPEACCNGKFVGMGVSCGI